MSSFLAGSLSLLILPLSFTRLFDLVFSRRAARQTFFDDVGNVSRMDPCSLSIYVRVCVCVRKKVSQRPLIASTAALTDKRRSSNSINNKSAGETKNKKSEGRRKKMGGERGLVQVGDRSSSM